MPNRLAHEISPYLLQHAENPVDWYPWGPEALDRARSEEKPIFLSIGYSACHWCHVMAHESFDDPDIAGRLNDRFVCIKVDREERPDLDQVYMEAVQMMTGRGGWPMSVFLTPELEPFFGGTYWPPGPRMGMPGFTQVIDAVADAWTNRRQEAVAQAGKLAGLMREDQLLTGSGPGAELGEPLLESAAAALGRAFDPQFGGFGPAPKFPHPLDVRLLLRRWRRTGQEQLLSMVTTTLDKMAGGGMYDQIGGGFHRYSTDARWLVPHFEKMLYDNALLAAAYLEAWQATGNEDYARVVRETLDYVLRDMTHPEGAFYSSEDADSEGAEGKFYVWTPAEIESVLGPERAKTFSYCYDVTEQGNFEGTSILNLPKTIGQCAKILDRDGDELRRQLAEDRCKLFGERSKRVRPGRDDKVLVSWNGLMIEAMAAAGAALDEPRYVGAAAAAAHFLLDHLRGDDGGLLHCWRDGEARHAAYLDDYAALASALVTLYEARFDERWIDKAVRLADAVLAKFADAREGGFFYTAADQEKLIARKKDVLDSSVPSGGGLAAWALLRLGKLTGRSDYLEAAERALQVSAPLMERAPRGTGQWLLALDALLGPMPEIAVIGPTDSPETHEVLGDLHRRYLPNKVVAFRDPAGPAEGRSQTLSGLMEGKEPSDGRPAVYVCRDFSCQAPAVGKEAAAEALDAAAQ